MKRYIITDIFGNTKEIVATTEKAALRAYESLQIDSLFTEGTTLNNAKSIKED